MNGVLLGARLVLAITFLVAALGKLGDRAGTREAAVAFGVPERLGRPVAAVLPFAELCAAVLLVLTVTGRAGAALAVALLAGFTLGIARALIRGEAPDCHCFGQIHSEPAGPRALVRNLLLGGLAILVLAGGGGASATAWLDRLSSTGLVALIAGIALALMGAACVMLAFSLLRRHGGLLLRIEALEQTLAARGMAVPAPTPAVPATEVGVPIGTAAPDFSLADLDGHRVSLDELRSGTRWVMLVFTDPGCGPCSALLPRLAAWQREHADHARIALISRGEPEANLAHAREHGLKDVLLQADHEVSERYMVNGTPGAVLIAPDGTVASDVHAGADSIEALVASRLARRHLVVHHQPGALGKPAPDATLRTLGGDELRLSERLEGRTALLFWNPGCGFCQRMLPDLRRFEARPPPDAPQLVLVSTGDPEANRAMELTAPILLDDRFAAGSAFGVSGTPSAVLVDEKGRIASEVAVGAPAVLELVGVTPTNGHRAG